MASSTNFEKLEYFVSRPSTTHCGGHRQPHRGGRTNRHHYPPAGSKDVDYPLISRIMGLAHLASCPSTLVFPSLGLLQCLFMGPASLFLPNSVMGHSYTDTQLSYYPWNSRAMPYTRLLHRFFIFYGIFLLILIKLCILFLYLIRIRNIIWTPVRHLI